MKSIMKINNKKAVSLMISYVLLVTIAIIMSIIVFTYLKTIANVEPVIDCKEGTSIVVEDYNCDPDKKEVSLTIRNNGRFNVDGFIATFGGNKLREPTTKLILAMNQEDVLYTPDKDLPPFNPPRFQKQLSPGDIVNVRFSNKEKKADGSSQVVLFEFLRNLKVQPYIIDEESELRVACGGKINKQDVEDCQIKGGVSIPTETLHYKFDGNLDSIIYDELPLKTQTLPKTNLDGSRVDVYSEGYPRYGQAINFDGSYNVRTSSKKLNPKLSPEFVTISLWIKKSSDNGILVKKYSGGNGFQIKIINNKIQFTTAGVPKTDTGIWCNTELSSNWEHIVVTAKKVEERKQKIYLNGNLCNTNDAGRKTLNNKNTNMFIGTDFIGKIDELKIWDKELTAEQVGVLYSRY